jgi:hypothetical protein
MADANVSHAYIVAITAMQNGAVCVAAYDPVAHRLWRPVIGRPWPRGGAWQALRALCVFRNVGGGGANGAGLPHRNEDVLVGPLVGPAVGRVAHAPLLDVADFVHHTILSPAETAAFFNTGELGRAQSPFVLAGTNVPSLVLVRSAPGQPVVIRRRPSDGKHRCDVTLIPGQRTDLSVTSLALLALPNSPVEFAAPCVLLLGFARPFMPTGSEEHRCYLMLIGLIDANNNMF